MRTSNAARPASAVAESEPHFDRLGGTIEETSSAPFDGGQADLARNTEAGFSDFEPVENQGFQEPEIDLAPEARHLRFERVNEVTVKVTDGRITITPTPPGRHWSGHKTTRAVAWIMGIGYGLWIVRYRNKASRPMKLPAAKTYALEMIKGIRPGIVLHDPIAHLNKISAAVIGANERRAPIEPDLLVYIREVETGVPPSRRPHGPTAEALQGDDYHLEYDDDGYPKLPSCLVRAIKPEESA